MVRYSHDDLPETGTSGDFFKDAARVARDTICNIHSDHPAVTTGIDGSIPGSAGSVRKAVMDSICRRSPAPPPSAPRALFSGGQCPVVYQVTFRTESFREGQPTVVQVFNSFLWGNLGAVSVRKNPSSFNELLFMRCHGGSTAPRSPEMIEVGIAGSVLDIYTSVEILQVARIDGLPDICGEPNPQYPPEDSKPLPIPFPIPPVDPPSPAFPPLPIIIPTGIFLDANFDIKIDVGGIQFNFDAGGVEFNLGNRDGCDGSQGSCSNPNAGGFPDDYANKDDVEDIINKAEEAKNAADGAKNAAEGAKKAADDVANNDGDHPQNDPNKQDKAERGEDDPKEEAGIERLLAVRVDLLEKPSNIREQFGNGAPNVYYAGWFQFSTKGSPHPRNYIHFEDNYFIAPTGADGFSYTVYQGIRAKHTVITAKEE